MNINIRLETEQDHRTVEEITREAFWNLYTPACSEHFVLHCMRSSPDFIPELAFVIELDGEIVGSIFYTHSKIVCDNGNVIPTITFGPVSILPRLHRKGLGRALITHSIEAARRLGHTAILIGGYPYHYAPYGFVGTKKYGISMPDGKFYTGIMALPLVDGALDGIKGVVHFSNTFEVDENAVAEFDKTFPVRQKLVLDCQKEFERAAGELDE